MLNIMKTIENGQGTLSLEGRLDTMTAPELELVLRDMLQLRGSPHLRWTMRGWTTSPLRACACCSAPRSR